MRTDITTVLRGAPIALLLLAPATALAEGSANLENQPVDAQTVLYVDILDSDVETIEWTGYGNIRVIDPDGYQLDGTFSTGSVIDLSSGRAGAWEIQLVYSQETGWDVSVLDPVEEGGRLFSYDWVLDTDTYGQDGSFEGSFYALVPGGSADHDGVIEIKFSGLSGRRWQMSANATGVNGLDAGRSVPISTDITYDPLYPIYLEPPTNSVYEVLTPSATGALTLEAHNDQGICGDDLASGYSTGTFTFETDIAATYHIVCDLNGDGTFDLTSNEDLALTGGTVEGTNEVEWDGLDNAGDPIPAGTYDCEVTVTVGEVHFVANDVETSYPGMRMYEMASQGSRQPLPMIWNDHLVQDLAEGMPNGQEGLVSPGPDGLDPGNYDEAAQPNTTARAWGSFTESGKGNYTYLDTFVRMRSSTSTTMQIEIIDGDTDENEDGYPDTCYAAYLRGGCDSTGGLLLGWLGLAAAGSVSTRRRRRTG